MQDTVFLFNMREGHTAATAPKQKVQSKSWKVRDYERFTGINEQGLKNLESQPMRKIRQQESTVSVIIHAETLFVAHLIQC